MRAYVQLDSRQNPTIPCPKATTRSQSWVMGPQYVWYACSSLATDWPYCFRLSDFPHIMEWWGSKCRLWVRKLGFFTRDFRGHVWTPHRS